MHWGLLIRRIPLLPLLLGGIVAQGPHLLQLIIDIGKASLGSQSLHFLQLYLRDILMQLRGEAEPLLSLLLILLRIVEVYKHTIILHIFLHNHGTLIREGRLRFDAIDRLLLLPLPEQRVIEGLLPTHALLLTDLQALRDEINGELGDELAVLHLLRVDGRDELQLVIGHPRRPPVQHLVIDQADRPKIRFITIPLLLQQLRRHVERSAHDGPQH